jgi:hypothetical protein
MLVFSIEINCCTEYEAVLLFASNHDVSLISQSPLKSNVSEVPTALERIRGKAVQDVEPVLQHLAGELVFAKEISVAHRPCPDSGRVETATLVGRLGKGVLQVGYVRGSEVAAVTPISHETAEIAAAVARAFCESVISLAVWSIGRQSVVTSV